MSYNNINLYKVLTKNSYTLHCDQHSVVCVYIRMCSQFYIYNYIIKTLSKAENNWTRGDNTCLILNISYQDMILKERKELYIEV